MAYTEDENYHVAFVEAMWRSAIQTLRDLPNLPPPENEEARLERECVAKFFDPAALEKEREWHVGVIRELLTKDVPDLAPFLPMAFEILRQERYEEITSFVTAWACDYFEIVGEDRDHVEASFDDSDHTQMTEKFPVELYLPHQEGHISIEVTMGPDGPLSARKIEDEDDDTSEVR